MRSPIIWCHLAGCGAPDTIGEMGGRGLRCALTAMAFAASTMGLVGCSSGGHLAVTKTQATRNDMVACASVDAVYALISRHQTVPSKIARRVISSSESADNAGLKTEARALQSDVTTADDAGINREMSALGGTCNSLGVGPAKY